MGAFDTAIAPFAVTPAVTTAVTLDPLNTTDGQFLIDICNLHTSAVTVSLGVTPDGGSLIPKLSDLIVPAKASYLQLGPFTLQVDDVFTVEASVADVVCFSGSGVVSS